MRAVFLLIVVFTFNLSLLGSHSKDDFRSQFMQAEEYIQNMEFNKAAEILEELVSQNPENANLQFKLGFCYLKSNLYKKKAITYLEMAAENTDLNYDPESVKETKAPYETPFFLAQACYHNHQFDRAKNLYESFKADIGPEASPELIAEIDRLIEINENARELVSKPLKIKVNPFPKGINTPAIEYAPVISGDEKTLIFTSNRIDNGTASINDPDDIYIVSKENDKWGVPKKLEEVSLPVNESSASLSFDGNTLILYVNVDENGALYESQKDGDTWSEPEEMPFPINGPDLETYGCYSPDKSSFYFTSDRPEGFGGLDIYVTQKMPNGMWSAASNLGPVINTPYDEESPFMHPDNERLFFSSAGHNTMGGLDVFFTRLKEGNEWEVPSNIGYPINTTGDEVGFSISVDGKRGYYASYNEKSLGETDLFMIDMPDIVYTDLMVFTGYAKDDEGQVILGAGVTAYDFATGEMFGVYEPNPRTGKFVIAARQGQILQLVFEAKGYKTFTRNIKVGSEEKNELVPEVAMKDATMEMLYAIPDYIFMPFDEFKIEMSTYELLPAFLLKFPDVKVNLIGHTDSKGPSWYNKRLGKKRADFIADYLEYEGINRDRITISSEGEDKPLAKNELNGKDSPDGRRINRRVEIQLINASKDKYTINKTPIPSELIVR